MNKPQATTPPRPADKAQPAELPLPHEREVSGRYTANQPPADVKQARKDLERGLVDTDLHNQAGLDAQQREHLLERERKATSGGRR